MIRKVNLTESIILLSLSLSILIVITFFLSPIYDPIETAILSFLFLLPAIFRKTTLKDSTFPEFTLLMGVAVTIDALLHISPHILPVLIVSSLLSILSLLKLIRNR
jgi:hypothetical protein